ncbi:hypothetical protein ACN4EG_00505 [Alkalinema pantanalense CENA528]|uniref:hypothetical protein n=1 Tax=Alkalinema pantanalense TaxID=1620705 RepID=UPI003D6F1446
MKHYLGLDILGPGSLENPVAVRELPASNTDRTSTIDDFERAAELDFCTMDNCDRTYQTRFQTIGGSKTVEPKESKDFE